MRARSSFLTILLFTGMLGSCISSYGQITEEELKRMLEPSEDAIGATTIGILQGGGSILGIDLEVLATKHLGIQAGAGLVGYGAAFNYHPKGGFRSSFLSLTWWHQGHRDSYVQSLLGPSYVFRGKRWFTAQIGLGFQVDKGPAAKTIDPDLLPAVQLLYSLGAYFPLK